MVDSTEALSKARKAVTDRADLPGMSLMEHLDELRRRIIHSALYLAAGFFVAWFFRNRILEFLQAPLIHIGKSLVFTHPMDALNLNLQASLLAGAIIASPFILYQVWLFIAPGLYQKEKRFVVPFMAATVGLFLAGASFGYFYVLPGAIEILVIRFGHDFTPMITIEDYISFFLSIILGLGISFETADPHLLPGHVRHCQSAVPLEEHSLCDSGGFPGGRHHYAKPRSVDDVHLRHPHARALPDRHRRGLVGPSIAPQGEGIRVMMFSAGCRRVI